MGWPATYRYYEAPRKRVVVGNPADDIPAFLRRGTVHRRPGRHMLKHLWFAGAERPATPLHFHVAMGPGDRHRRPDGLATALGQQRERLFVKPVPRFLLDPAFLSQQPPVPLMAVRVAILR